MRNPSISCISSIGCVAQGCHTGEEGEWGEGFRMQKIPFCHLLLFFFSFFFFQGIHYSSTQTQSPHVAASLVNHNQQFSQENRQEATVWVPAGGIGLGKRGTSSLTGRKTEKCHKQQLWDESARRSGETFRRI